MRFVYTSNTDHWRFFCEDFMGFSIATPSHRFTLMHNVTAKNATTKTVSHGFKIIFLGDKGISRGSNPGRMHTDCTDWQAQYSLVGKSSRNSGENKKCFKPPPSTVATYKGPSKKLNQIQPASYFVGRDSDFAAPKYLPKMEIQILSS